MTHTTTNVDTTVTVDTISKTGKHRWLALGDSYTIGESVEELQRFPAQAISLLQKDLGIKKFTMMLTLKIK